MKPPSWRFWGARVDRLRQHSKKTLIGIVGGLVVLVGLVLIPYPGPGWLVVFAGLAILSAEFTFAERLLKYARTRYDGWAAWLKRQSILVKLLVLACTGLVVLVRIWVLYGFGILRWLLVSLFGVGDSWSWFDSPWF